MNVFEADMWHCSMSSNFCCDSGNKWQTDQLHPESARDRWNNDGHFQNVRCGCCALWKVACCDGV